MCAKAFVATLDYFINDNPKLPEQIQDVGFRWYRLDHLLDEYNRRVQQLSPELGEAFWPNRFKLKTSADIRDLELVDPNDPVSPGWCAYFRCRGGDDKFCDVQVDYQMSLRSL